MEKASKPRDLGSTSVPTNIFHVENENSKKPFPKEVIPYLRTMFQSTYNLECELTNVSGMAHFGHIILPWRLCLQAFNPKRYTYGMVIAILPPLTQWIISMLRGMLHTLVIALAKDFDEL